MAGRDRNLRGSTSSSRSALVLCDLLSDFCFDDAAPLLKRAQAIAPTIERLRARADRAGVPVIYVNDNVGAWRSDKDCVLQAIAAPTSKFPDALQPLLPRDDDYFVLKPKHSAFFGTPLASLLSHLQTKQIVLCGLATEICIMFTAHDAYLLGHEVVVPRDACAGATPSGQAMALSLMTRALKVQTPTARGVRWRRS